MKLERKEFEGNILVTISDREVRLWVCKNDQNIFRFKATGKVYYGSGTDVIITPEKEISEGEKYGN